MYRIVCGILILCGMTAQAQTVKLPAEVKGDVGAFVRVPAETVEKEVRWYSPDAGLAVFPVELLKDSKTAVVTATKAGRYRMVAWTAKGDVPSLPAECVVVIGNAPVPPGPGPDPPLPTDPLTVAIRAALATEPSPEKIAFVSKLADLYTSAAQQVKTTDKTKASEFHAAMKAARIALIGEAVPLVRAEVTKYLDGKLPTTVDAPLDAPTKELCAKEFMNVATALRSCCP